METTDIGQSIPLTWPEPTANGSLAAHGERADQERPRPTHAGVTAESPTTADSLLPRATLAPLLLLTVILVAGLALRFHDLSARSLWFDEAFAWRLVEFPWREMGLRLAQDNSPPLYYGLLKLWMGVFGPSLFALRSLSVLLGGATIVGSYLLAREALHGDEPPDAPRRREMALFLAALVASSTFQIRYSGEVRPYALGAALAAWSSWALFRALHGPPRSLRPWLLYGLLALLFAYTHYYALFSIAAQGLFVIGCLVVRAGGQFRPFLREPRLRGALVAAAIVVLGWLPWAPIFLAQKAQVEAAFWTRSVAPWDFCKVCYQMFAEPEAVFSSSRRAYLFAADLCFLGALVLCRKARPADWYVLAAALVPFACSALLSECGTKVFGLRYFLFAHLFFLAGLAFLVGRIRSRVVRGLTGLLVLVNAVAGHLVFLEKMDLAHSPGYRGAVEFLRQHRQADEPVVVCSPLVYLPVRYCARGEPGYFLWDTGHEIVHFHGRAVLSPEDFLTEETLLARAPCRVWVVNTSAGMWSDLTVLLSNRWRAVATTTFTETLAQGKVQVVEYVAASE